jgi:hypothetical protein
MVDNEFYTKEKAKANRATCPNPALKKIDICAGTTFSLILASLRGTGPPHPEREVMQPAETFRMHPRTNVMGHPGRFGAGFHPDSNLYFR